MSDPAAKTGDAEPVEAGGSGEHASPSLNIVALDDDADFREYLRTVLESDGHAVRMAQTPEDLYRACEEKLPDVVFVDMKMGRHAGETVIEELRRRWTKLCIIVITGYPTMEGMRQTFKRDVYDYLAKPFSHEELRRTLLQAVDALGLGRRPQDRLRHELGRQMKLARIEHGWTLKELSEAAGVSVSQLSAIERGSHLPSLESLLAIAEATGKQPSTWLAGAGF